MRRHLLPAATLCLALAAPGLALAADDSGGASAPFEVEPAPPTGGSSYSEAAARRQEAARKREAAARKREALEQRRAAAKRRRAAALREKRLRAERKRDAKRQADPPETPSPASGHRFPIVGSFTFGEEGSRFGAGRTGHKHQGQDMAADEGTTIVAPRSGVIKTVQYQAGGAGHYFVLDGDGEDRDYVFMHLRARPPVKPGQHVSIGQKVGEVGNTGGSSGPHLHFEVWVGGGWYTGGHPIDPLPILRSWL